MNIEVNIILYKHEMLIDLHLSRLIEFYGIPCKMVCINQADDLSKFLSYPSRPACVMVSARSLAAIFQDATISSDGITELFDRVPFVFVYGITSGAQETYAVKHLTDGVTTSVASFDRSDHQYEVIATEREITNEFSGLKFGPINSTIDYGLVVNQKKPGFKELVSIDGLSIFAYLKKRNTCIFLLACCEVLDLNENVNDGMDAHEYFSRIVPVLMFLKYVFGDQTWHNPRSRANFIIDDLPLQKSYGFMNYDRLLKEMDQSEFTTTIAFIPWNYKRARSSTAKLIKERSDRFSICMHGCDHVGGEFASSEVERLNDKISLATQRMSTLEQYNGIPYDEVMVFPQGKFSTTSFNLLKSHNYLAAINTHAIPDDLGDKHGLVVSDLLQPTISKYSSFPLFMRRYPGEIADFAFDLFLGKPILIVEHHHYFKHGYDKIRSLIKQLNTLSRKLQWTSLKDLISHSYLQKRISQNVFECKLSANRHIIENTSPIKRTYIILKQETSMIPLQSVLIDGERYPYDIENDDIRLTIGIPPHSKVEVKFSYSNMHPSYKGNSSSLRHKFKISMRRYLSEFRDNYISRYSGALTLANNIRIKNFIKSLL